MTLAFDPRVVLPEQQAIALGCSQVAGRFGGDTALGRLFGRIAVGPHQMPRRFKADPVQDVRFTIGAKQKRWPRRMHPVFVEPSGQVGNFATKIVKARFM